MGKECKMLTQSLLEFQMDMPFLCPFCYSCSVLLLNVNGYLIISPEKTLLKELNEADLGHSLHFRSLLSASESKRCY